ncbi:MAG: hypothetical protein Harvfovirus16_11 [Harvfovirus sp.]|uniref:Uncharacterized protein n=1 Tax=Harvfovirus sp. TaxID=2487768 RepID=A0A3G5A1V3_9VIRU|nr:MAG: hypothetical protein Harvfovirus16_11 [Harvfovirus sp.]
MNHILFAVAFLTTSSIVWKANYDYHSQALNTALDQWIFVAETINVQNTRIIDKEGFFSKWLCKDDPYDPYILNETRHMELADLYTPCEIFQESKPYSIDKTLTKCKSVNLGIFHNLYENCHCYRKSYGINAVCEVETYYKYVQEFVLQIDHQSPHFTRREGGYCKGLQCLLQMNTPLSPPVNYYFNRYDQSEIIKEFTYKESKAYLERNIAFYSLSLFKPQEKA